MVNYVMICVCGQRQTVEIRGIKNVHSSSIKGNCEKCGKVSYMRLGL